MSSFAASPPVRLRSPEGYSLEDAPTATHAMSEFFTLPTSNFFAEAVIRVSASAIGIGGFVSPFFAL
jgi:hypothetical protein